MIYSHKGYQCLLLPRVSKKSVQWSCKPKSSDSMEQQAFVTWSRAKLIVDIDILQAKQKFTSLVELFLQERSTEFPLYPRPEMPDATIEAIVDDGSEVVFEIYKASVIWDGQEQIIDVAASDADPLVGMGLLYGFNLQIEAIEGGRVTIEALS
jgi:hypothetical protein